MCRHVTTARAQVQLGEKVDLPMFDTKESKPMMEMEAGSNVWYQATILRVSANEIRVLFPGARTCVLASLCTCRAHTWLCNRSCGCAQPALWQDGALTNIHWLPSYMWWPLDSTPTFVQHLAFLPVRGLCEEASCTP
jgi:hypothetical protein